MTRPRNTLIGWGAGAECAGPPAWAVDPVVRWCSVLFDDTATGFDTGKRARPFAVWGGVPYKRPPVKNASPRPSGLDLPVTSSGDRRPDHPPPLGSQIIVVSQVQVAHPIDARSKCEYGPGSSEPASLLECGPFVP